MGFLCRLCGQCENCWLGVPILGEQGVKEELAYKIEFSLGISVSEYDPFPKYICECCLGIFNTICTFQESCRSVQLLVWNHFQSSTTWPLNATTSKAEVEQLPDESIHGTAGETSVQERTFHILEDTSYSQISENEEDGGNLITEVLSPSELKNLQTQPSFVPAESAVGSSPETVQIEEVVVRPNVYVAPWACGTPQIVNLLNVQEHTPPSTLQSSSKQNWHSPSPTEDQFNSLPSSACSIQSSSRNPLTIRNWHTPVPANNPQISSIKKEKVVNSGSTMNSSSHPEEEDEVLVAEVVKANKKLIAQHWERCPSGFICKHCNKQYKILNKCEDHIRIHLGVKPYECQICKRRYQKMRVLNEHYSFHMGKKLYQCKKCDMSFRYRKMFKNHAESHVEEFNSSYSCEICNKTFLLQYDYWNHITSKHVIVESQMAEVELRE